MRCKNPKVHYNGLTVKAVWTGLYNIIEPRISQNQKVIIIHS